MHEENDNSVAPRTVGALAMRPTGNAQGSFFFFSLDSGRTINRLCATHMHMPHKVIDRVTQLARQQKADPGLVFLGRNKHPQHEGVEEEDDETYQPEDDDNDDRMMKTWMRTCKSRMSVKTTAVRAM